MPQFYYDWNLWWLEMWHDNPLLFWGAVALAFVLVLLPRRH